MADAAANESPKVPPELGLACAILNAYVRKNTLPAGDVPAALRKIYGSLTGLQGAPTGTQPSAKPAVPVKKSIGDDYLVCLEDGCKLSMLKRHLRTRHGLSPDEYRAKWNLPADYPMTAPRYTKTRSALAKEAGLGRYPGAGRGKREDAPSGRKA